MQDLIWQIPLGVFLLVFARCLWKVTNEDDNNHGNASVHNISNSQRALRRDTYGDTPS